MVKFLIIRLSSIGDIVLTTPLIRCIKNQVEEAEIHYLTKESYSSLLVANPNIDKLHLLKGNISGLIKKLKYEHYDYLIDLHNNIRTYRLKTGLKVLSFTIDKINIKKWLMVNLKINRLPDKHIVDRYMETVNIFDVKNDGKGLDYYIPENDIVDLSVLPEHFRKAYIGFSIGGQHNTKKLPVEKIISVCNKLDLPVVLLGGRDDSDIAEMIRKKCGKNIYNACGKFSINQSAYLVKQAKLIISNDTGLMHIAAAFNKHVISLWGNTIPAFGMYPYLPEDSMSESNIIQVEDLKCRPCSKIGYNKCPRKHFRCMKDIDEEQIIMYCKNILS